MDTLFSIVVILIVLSCSYVAWTSLRNQQWLRAMMLVILIGVTGRLFVMFTENLHQWDEKYHALVGKNLVKHPLKPTLYDNPVLSYDVTNWVGNHVWLDKPPVALWGIACSVGLFGEEAWAVRLPSLLYGLFAIFLTFNIGNLLFDKRVGVMAAFLHAIHGVIIELGAGRISSDHVETAFIFYVELAVFLIIYFNRIKAVYSVSALIGATAGFAFLSKWYPAAIVLLLWSIGFIYSEKKSIGNFFKHGLIVILGMGVIVLPWIYYIKVNFHAESSAVLNKFLSAYSSPIEAHSAAWYYYLYKILVLYGELVYVVLIFAIYKLLKGRSSFQFLLLIVWIAVPLVVFSMAETKRYTYLLISAPAYFILTANFWFFLYERFQSGGKKIFALFTMTTLLILPLRLFAERMKFFQPKHEPLGFYENLREYRNRFDSNDIVFGTKDYIEMMFFTDVSAAYPAIPEDELLLELRSQAYDIFILTEDRLIEFEKKPIKTIPE